MLLQTGGRQRTRWRWSVLGWPSWVLLSHNWFLPFPALLAVSSTLSASKSSPSQITPDHGDLDGVEWGELGAVVGEELAPRGVGLARPSRGRTLSCSGPWDLSCSDPLWLLARPGHSGCGV